MKNRLLVSTAIAFLAANHAFAMDYFDETGYYDTFGHAATVATKSAADAGDVTTHWYSGSCYYSQRINGVTWYFTLSGGVADLGGYKKTAIESSLAGNVSVPSSLGGCPVTSIGYYAFYGCDGLTSVTIPDSVTSIGDMAFYGCDSLKYVAIPDSVTSIGEGSFEECYGLKTVTIPDSVMGIGGSAFEGCDSVLFDTTTIPGVKLVDGWAVGYESSLSGDLDLSGVRGIGGEVRSRTAIA